jgi:Sulfotransferase domain
MQNLIAGVLFGIDLRFAPDSLIQSLTPDVHVAKSFRRYSTPTFFKTHHLPRADYRRVIYLIRDGRDAMVSYFHFLSALKKSTPDFLKIVATGKGLFPCRWHEHVEAWMANPYRAQMITISYEALKFSPVEELMKICAFAALQRQRSFLQNVAESASFEVMQEKEKRFGWDDRGIWPKDRAFVRRGAVGSFKDEMPPSVLASFTEQSSNALKRFRYD